MRARVNKCAIAPIDRRRCSLQHSQRRSAPPIGRVLKGEVMVMRDLRTGGVMVKGAACLLAAVLLASSTAPVTASQTTSAPSSAQIGAAEADYVDAVHAGVQGAIEGYVAGGIAGALIGHIPGAGTGMAVGAVSGFVASVVMYMLGYGGDQYELTGLPKNKRLPNSVLD
jgi:hypothetical protein